MHIHILQIIAKRQRKKEKKNSQRKSRTKSHLATHKEKEMPSFNSKYKFAADISLEMQKYIKMLPMFVLNMHI